MRSEIARAGGREVCFLATVDLDRTVVSPRAVARGNYAAVLAAARDEPEGGVMIHNHPSGRLEPSDADLGVAAQLWEQGLGTAITDNAVTALYVVVEPPAPRVRHPLDLDALEAIVAPGGPLSRLHRGYEDRPGQREMVRRVAGAYNDGGVLLVEAGTGTGKSIGYLLAAARAALDNDERTVVSTATINLQAQLAAKDLPLVASLLGALPDGGTRGANPSESGEGAKGEGGAGLTWALVKGRGNYISIRRLGLAGAGASELFETDRSRELEALREWVRVTEDGSLSDLPAPPSSEVWDEVRSDPDICLRSRCPHFQRCFYQRSRRKASSARILVVNHHLLFTDLAVRRATQNWSQSAVLPAYRHVVLDEAHNVEDAATSHLGVEVTRRGLYRTLSRLDRRGKGVLAAIQEGLARSEGAGRELRRRVEERVRPAVDEVRAALDLFFDVVEALLPSVGAGEGEAVRIVPVPIEPVGTEDASQRVVRERVIEEPVSRVEVRERLRGLLGSLQKLERELQQVRRQVEGSEELEERLDGRLLDLRSAERRTAAAQVALKLVLEPGERIDDFVRWLEARGRGRGRNLALCAAPIDLGPVLRESLWGRSDTVILSSATLTTRGNFDFMRERLGLSAGGLADMEEAPSVDGVRLPSPFDFSRQAILAVPRDLPAATAEGDGLQRATARVISSLAGHTGGGVFALFTSFRALRRVAELLREDGLDARFPLFVHGEDDRARLLADFIAHGDGILLGTSSFWEGVDVPGDPLRALVIQKLPFRVPTEPVTAARVEALEARGGNAFWGYMLPLAALRLKQGFGRLVRHRDDRGAVVLLDDRILRKSYGRYLLDSLPDAPLVKGTWSDVERSVRRFYEGGDAG
jgi:ATP-dependent DNA helicase DinG